MAHDEARAQLEALIDGEFSNRGLDRNIIGEVRRHVSSCVECSETLATLWLLTDSHPTADRVVDYALEREMLPVGERAALDWHVRLCEDCHQAMVSVQEAERNQADAPSPSLPTQVSSRHRWSSWLPLAAALALGVIIVPFAYRGLITLPDVRSSLRSSEQRAADSAKRLEIAEQETERLRTAAAPRLARLEIVRQTRRDDAGNNRLQVDRKVDTTTLTLVFAIEAGFAHEQVVHLTITDKRGASLHSDSATIGDLRLLLADRGGLLWRVPTAVLENGRLRVSVAIDKGATLLDALLTVEDGT